MAQTDLGFLLAYGVIWLVGLGAVAAGHLSAPGALLLLATAIVTDLLLPVLGLCLPDEAPDPESRVEPVAVMAPDLSPQNLLTTLRSFQASEDLPAQALLWVDSKAETRSAQAEELAALEAALGPRDLAKDLAWSESGVLVVTVGRTGGEPEGVGI